MTKIVGWNMEDGTRRMIVKMHPSEVDPYREYFEFPAPDGYRYETDEEVRSRITKALLNE